MWAQSFNKDDVLHWIANEPAFGKQAVYLDDANVPADVPSAAELKGYAKQGIKIVAPPMWVLLDVKNGKIVPSQYAKDAKAAGLDIITWTIERSGRIVQEVLPTKGTASPSFYYQTTLDALHNDGDLMTTLDVLAKQVGILGIFSDWSGTVELLRELHGAEVGPTTLLGRPGSAVQGEHRAPFPERSNGPPFHASENVPSCPRFRKCTSASASRISRHTVGSSPPSRAASAGDRCMPGIS